MEITDRTGKQITVTDLDKAINQAKAFCAYKHIDGKYKKLDRELRGYWNDIYKKLISLKNKK